MSIDTETTVSMEHWQPWVHETCNPSRKVETCPFVLLSTRVPPKRDLIVNFLYQNEKVKINNFDHFEDGTHPDPTKF